MDSKRTGAIKLWFEQLLKAKLCIEPVDGWATLYKRHIPIVTHLIITGKFKQCEEKSSNEAYTKAYEALKDQSVDALLLAHLKPDLAATGDNFEVAKFLVVLLNELRISVQTVFNENYGLTEEQNNHIGAVLRYLEDHQCWDPYESWPAVLFQTDDENGSLINVTDNFITPKTWRSNRAAITMSERTELKRSPLSEVVASPRSRELRIAREKDRKIKTLNERCKLLEYEKDDLEGSLRIAEQENKKLAKSLNEVNGIVNEKEARCQTLSTEMEDWRIRAAGAEEENNDLKQQLKATKQELHITQRQLREVEFDVSSKQRALENWQKNAAQEEQWRLKMEREREELLQELEAARMSKATVEEQLRQLTTNDEAEIAELRNIIDVLRSEIKESRRERDEALISQDEKVRSKESEIARFANIIAEMKKQLRGAQLSVQVVRSLAVQVRNFCGEMENRRTEIQGLRLMMNSIQSGCYALQQENAQRKAMIESLRNNVAISEYQSKALAASLEDQRKKHLELITAKQEIINEKQQMLFDAWDRLHSSVELNIHLQQELTQKDVAYHVLEQRLASAEEKCSTVSQRFSISNGNLDSKLIEEAVKANNHFSEAAGDVSTGALPHEFHPLPETEDENDLLSSSSVNGNPYVLNVEVQCGRSVVADERGELNTSVDSERLAELNRRNKSVPPHMRSTYATELTYAAERFPLEKLEEALKNFENFGSYIRQKGKNDASSLMSPSSISKKKSVSRSLQNVKRQFYKVIQESSATKQRVTKVERSPLKPKN